MKWYNESVIDDNEIISSRVRLARNVKKYPFSSKLDAQKANELIAEAVASIKNDRTMLGQRFDFVNINDKSPIENMAMVEKHIISPEFLKYQKPRGVLVQEDEKVSVMINEEDHLRIQAVYPGENIDEAWFIADKIDDLIEESTEYAFDREYGYLTSCPTNTGTGMRASYMVHVPFLEMSGQLKNLLQAIGKFGLTIRGIYGESTEPQGSIYQISNQITMGKSEKEIVSTLKSVTTQIIENEQKIRDSMLKDLRTDIEDRVYRAYGILENCRRIDSKEAMNLLSYIRIGVMLGFDMKKPKLNIYNIMMNIQFANLQLNYGKQMNDNERDIIRAKYLREVFG